MNNKILEDNSKYIISNYSRYPISIVNGEGSYVYDSESKKYLDFISGIAVNNLGHNNKKVNNAINKQLKNLVHVSNLFVIPNQVNFAKEIVKNKPGHKVFSVIVEQRLMKQHLRFQENGESLITKKLLFHLLVVFTVEPLVL